VIKENPQFLSLLYLAQVVGGTHAEHRVTLFFLREKAQFPSVSKLTSWFNVILS